MALRVLRRAHVDHGAQTGLRGAFGAATPGRPQVRIPKFQIVKRDGERPHAEFLVVARLGAVTFGLWRRYSHFERLNQKVCESFPVSDYQNTHWSWRCLRRRQRWFRCLDQEYLALKCFLLERFLHDLVFEAASSAVFAEFLELQMD